jgi:hypothetical protein
VCVESSFQHRIDDTVDDDVKLSGGGETLLRMPSAPKRASVSCTRIRRRVDDNLLPGRVGLRRAWGLHRWMLNCHGRLLHCTDLYAKAGNVREIESAEVELAKMPMIYRRSPVLEETHNRYL